MCVLQHVYLSFLFVSFPSVDTCFWLPKHVAQGYTVPDKTVLGLVMIWCSISVIMVLILPLSHTVSGLLNEKSHSTIFILLLTRISLEFISVSRLEIIYIYIYMFWSLILVFVTEELVIERFGAKLSFLSNIFLSYRSHLNCWVRREQWMITYSFFVSLPFINYT